MAPMTRDEEDVEPHGGPAAALQQGVANDLDVVAAPDEVGNPADARGNVLDGKMRPESRKTRRNPPSATA